jgi:hypothetical protein
VFIGFILRREWALISGKIKQFLPYLLTGETVALVVYFWLTRRSPKKEFFGNLKNPGKNLAPKSYDCK